MSFFGQDRIKGETFTQYCARMDKTDSANASKGKEKADEISKQQIFGDTKVDEDKTGQDEEKSVNSDFLDALEAVLPKNENKTSILKVIKQLLGLQNTQKENKNTKTNTTDDKSSVELQKQEQELREKLNNSQLKTGYNGLELFKGKSEKDLKNAGFSDEQIQQFNKKQYIQNADNDKDGKKFEAAMKKLGISDDMIKAYNEGKTANNELYKIFQNQTTGNNVETNDESSKLKDLLYDNNSNEEYTMIENYNPKEYTSDLKGFSEKIFKANDVDGKEGLSKEEFSKLFAEKDGTIGEATQKRVTKLYDTLSEFDGDKSSMSLSELAMFFAGADLQGVEFNEDTLDGKFSREDFIDVLKNIDEEKFVKTLNKFHDFYKSKQGDDNG